LTPFDVASHPGSEPPLCSTYVTGPRKIATVITDPSAVRTLATLTAGLGLGVGAGDTEGDGDETADADAPRRPPVPDAAAVTVSALPAVRSGPAGRLAVHATARHTMTVAALARRRGATGRTPAL
jgi:hypothetical protein